MSQRRTQRRLDEKQQVTLLSNSICGEKNLQIEYVCAPKASSICRNSVSISSVSSASSLSSTASVSLCWFSRVYLTSFVSTSHSLRLCSVQHLFPPPPLPPFFTSLLLCVLPAGRASVLFLVMRSRGRVSWHHSPGPALAAVMMRQLRFLSFHARFVEAGVFEF